MRPSRLPPGTRIVVAGLVLLLAAAVLASWWALRDRQPPAAPPAVATPTQLPTTIPPTPLPPTPAPATPLPPTAPPTEPLVAATVVLATAAAPTPVPSHPLPARAEDDYDRLFAVILPPADPLLVAAELDGRTAPTPAAGATPLASPTPPAVGDRATFTTSQGPRLAEMIYADDHAGYWVEDGLTLDRDALIAAAGRLRQNALPLLSERFGDPAQPGIDGDPRVHILHILGSTDAVELGYFRDQNQYPRWLEPDSNEREMFFMNMTRLSAGSALYEGTLVHEMQHLIQWRLDPNEDTWFNEGLAQVAETAVGLDTVDATAYREQPYIRLDGWSNATAEVDAHYAAGYLYLLYLWEQAGDAALSEVARHPANGLAAVRAVLAGHRPDLSWETFTGDWAATVFLDSDAAEPRYRFDHDLDLGPAFLANRVRRLPFEATAALDQMAVDVIDLDFSGPATLSFTGDASAALVDGPPPGGGAFWFAPPGNSSRAQLTAELDLTAAAAPALAFDVWHDLEPAYDFAYLSASTDGGQTWVRLSPDEPVYGPYGRAWGGPSAGWRQEVVSLAAYAGQRVRVRFDVLTDFEGLGRGFAVSGLSVTGVDAQPAWQPAGFVETGAVLPQRWELRLIREGAAPQVIRLAPDAANRGEWAIDLGPEGGALVVMPVTPLVASTAGYWLRIDH